MNPSHVLGNIVKSFHGVDQTTTLEAWESEIKIMQQVLQPWATDNEAYVCFEYDIPRLGKRIDVVVLLGGMVFCLEFKVGKRDALQMDVEQVLDYALDLKNFHLYSADRPIVPILIPTEYSKESLFIQLSPYNDEIYNPIITSKDSLQKVMAKVLEHGSKKYDLKKWGANWLKVHIVRLRQLLKPRGRSTKITL